MSIPAQSSAAAKPPLDTVMELLTPEHVRFQYRLAGAGSRAFAFCLDALVKSGAYIGFGLLTKYSEGFGWGSMLVLMFILEWLYFVGFEIFWNGQSPGKRVLGLRVIGIDGTPLTWQQSVVRNLLRPADQFPLVYGVGVISTILSSKAQRLGDMAAGTMVVVEDRPSRMPGRDDIPPDIEPLVMQLPAGMRLERDLRQAVLLYGAKRANLPAALREELIRPLVPRLLAVTNMPQELDPDRVVAAVCIALTQPTGTEKELGRD